jgi:hypothetical protein
MLGVLFAGWPLSAHAEQPTKVSRVGILSDDTASFAAKSLSRR